MSAQAAAEAKVRRQGFCGPQDELALAAMRFRIWRACDVACASGRKWRSSSAREIAALSCVIANGYQFNRTASAQELQQVLDALTKLHSAARTIERIEAPHA